MALLVSNGCFASPSVGDYLGTQILESGWYRQFHWTSSRVDLSLFQLGLRFLDYMPNQSMAIGRDVFLAAFRLATNRSVVSPGIGGICTINANKKEDKICQ